MTPLVFTDCETTGIHPERQAWEVAMIRRDGVGQRRIEFFIDVDLSQADPFGLQVGGFYDRHPMGRRLASGSSGASRSYTEERAAYRIAEWTHGAHIVGVNPSFDTSTLEPLLRSHGLIPAWNYHLIDVGPMAYGWLLHAGTRVDLPYRSDDLGAALGVTPLAAEKRHTAMGDAEWVMAMYDAMTGGAA